MSLCNSLAEHKSHNMRPCVQTRDMAKLSTYQRTAFIAFLSRASVSSEARAVHVYSSWPWCLALTKFMRKPYRVFINYCVIFPFCDFSELCQFCCSAGFLPAWCVYSVHTLTPWENRERPESRIFLKIRKKHNI